MPTVDDSPASPPPTVDSPELVALREELGTLHDIFASLAGGSIRASEWPRAKRALDYMDEKIKPLEARVQVLVATPEPEVTSESVSEAARRVARNPEAY